MELATSEQLRHQAHIFERAAAKFLELADLLDGTAKPTNGTVQVVATSRKGSRKSQLAEFLRRHGPCERQYVIKNSGLPKGTIQAYLTKRHFDQDDEGRWKVKAKEEKDAE
jgi:hypothetical protein